VKELKHYFIPNTLEEAQKLLREPALNARILAGGTSPIFTSEMKFDAVVDITRLGLDYIRLDDKNVYIGTAVTVAELAASPVIAQLASGLLTEAALTLGNSHIRNMVTLGGNTVLPFLWYDLPVALLALEAKIKIKGSQEEIISLEQYYKNGRHRNLNPGEIVTEIIVPLSTPETKGKWLKFARTKVDFNILDFAVGLEIKAEICTKAVIVLGGASALPLRLQTVEELLIGKTLTEDLIAQAAKAARELVKPVSNIRASAEYRSEMIEVLLKRLLRALRG
jgi:CO/xanthine dehydrogenase FAD-binding subunit